MLLNKAAGFGATADECGQAEHPWFHTSCHRLSSGRYLGAYSTCYWAKIQVSQFAVFVDTSIQICVSLLPEALPTGEMRDPIGNWDQRMLHLFNVLENMFTPRMRHEACHISNILSWSPLRVVIRKDTTHARSATYCMHAFPNIDRGGNT